MASSMDIGTAVGNAVQRRRIQRGLSAAELARRAGLSKATLSTLEAGEANPTIGTLSALAEALAIPLSDLVEHHSRQEDIYIPPRPPAGDSIEQHRLSRLSGITSAETWTLFMPANSAFDGVPHAEGTIESIFVVSGELHVSTESGTHTLAAGSFLSFHGEQAHSYQAFEPTLVVTVLAAG